MENNTSFQTKNALQIEEMSILADIAYLSHDWKLAQKLISELYQFYDLDLGFLLQDEMDTDLTDINICDAHFH